MKRLLAGVILALALAAPAHAASSITLNQIDPHLGGPATFTLVMPAKYGCTNGLCKSHVELVCSQAGVEVYRDYVGSDAAQTTGFALIWFAGPADCIATLSFVDRRTDVTLATTSFTAAG